MQIKYLSCITLSALAIIGVTNKPLNSTTLSLPTPTISHAPIASLSPSEVVKATYKIRGFDVSHYQNAVDWSQVSTVDEDSSKVSFVFIRATMGCNRNDNNFIQNWQSAKKAGLIRAAYHFYDPHQSAELQAKHFLNSVKMEAGDLPPVLDIEKSKKFRRKSDITTFQKNVKIWLQIVEKATGVRPIVYSGYRFFNDYLDNTVKEYPVWLAYYNLSDLNMSYSKKWHFWQHTDKGRVSGVSGNVDLNVFNGTQDELHNLCIKKAIPQQFYAFKMPPVVHKKITLKKTTHKRSKKARR
jgi:lysozyme